MHQWLDVPQGKTQCWVVVGMIEKMQHINAECLSVPDRSCISLVVHYGETLEQQVK